MPCRADVTATDAAALTLDQASLPGAVGQPQLTKDQAGNEFRLGLGDREQRPPLLHESDEGCPPQAGHEHPQVEG